MFALNARVDRLLVDGSAPGIPSDLHAAILWRNGCNGCAISTEVEPTTDEIVESVTGETAARLSLQPVDIVGDFPNDFTIAFGEEPPAEVIDIHLGYPTGVLVLARSGEPQTYVRDARFLQIGFSYPLLFAEDAEALGIVAMAPLYVSFVAEGSSVMDTNMSETTATTDGGGVVIDGSNLEPSLSGGYHVARHNGVAVNASVRRFVCTENLGADAQDVMAACNDDYDGTDEGWQAARACEEVIVTGHCGTAPDVYGSIEVLESNASVSLTIDGNEDLLHALDGLTLDDLLAE